MSRMRQQINLCPAAALLEVENFYIYTPRRD